MAVLSYNQTVTGLYGSFLVAGYCEGLGEKDAAEEDTTSCMYGSVTVFLHYPTSSIRDYAQPASSRCVTSEAAAVRLKA